MKKYTPILMAVVASLVLGGTAINATASEEAQKAVSSKLPSGLTIKSASTAQLAAAVKAAVTASPNLASDIVSTVVGQLGKNGRAAKAVVIAALQALPNATEETVAAIVKAAVAANPGLAGAIRSGALAVFPNFAKAIANAVAEGLALARATGGVFGSGPGGDSTNPANYSGGRLNPTPTPTPKPVSAS